MNKKMEIKYESVDLGLPSGLKWGKTNIGTDIEGECGLYFAWGDTNGHKLNKEFMDNDYKFYDGYFEPKLSLLPKLKITKYNTDPNHNFVDDKTVLEPIDDAATVNMGGGWRMPTKEDFGELIDNTVQTRCLINGNEGWKFTSNIDKDKYIFIPLSGICHGGRIINMGYDSDIWTSSLFDKETTSAYFLNAYGFHSDNINLNYAPRSWGLCIRGVYQNIIQK